MALTYAPTPHLAQFGRVLERIKELRATGTADLERRTRIRAIMDGGPRGIQAVMAWEQGRQGGSPEDVARKYGVDLPTVNLMASGVERLAQQVGDIPRLRASEAYERDLRERFNKRRSIVADWDQYQQLEAHFPQIGRWLPGYTHTVWTISQGYYGYSKGEVPYPRAELRDSFDTYCGFSASGEEPDDVLVLRRIPLRVLRANYPDISWNAAAAELERKYKSRPLGTGGPSKWEGEDTGVEVCEYLDANGRSLVIAELSLQVAFTENPIYPEPPFVVARKYSFSDNVSAYHHVVGLVAMMAKLNLLGLIASEEGVFGELNIFGEPESGEYQRGRFAINRFEQGARVERRTGDQPQTLWAQIDRVERQMRIGAAYDVSADGISPNSYATGQGIQQLQSGMARNVDEYRKVIRLATQRLDTRRLMWAEAVWPNLKTKIYHYGSTNNRTYRPSSDIKGDYRTRRSTPISGIWGTPSDTVQGAQSLQLGAIGVEELQDAMGIENGEAILARNRARKAEEALLGRFTATPPGQPFMPGVVEAVLVEIMQNPDDQEEILAKYMVPPEPEPTAPELGALGPEGMTPEGAPPGIWDLLGSRPTQTALSRVMTNGTADAGLQLAGAMPQGALR